METVLLICQVHAIQQVLNTRRQDSNETLVLGKKLDLQYQDEGIEGNARRDQIQPPITKSISHPQMQRRRQVCQQVVDSLHFSFYIVRVMHKGELVVSNGKAAPFFEVSHRYTDRIRAPVWV